MASVFGRWTWAFLAFVSRLRVLADASLGVVDRIGVLGSVWQVSVGIPQGWVAAIVNAGVLASARTPSVRRAYLNR